LSVLDVDARPLADPVWAALTGPHAHLAQRIGQAVRYPPDVASFVALADPGDPLAWADLAGLCEPGEVVALARTGLEPPPGWETVFRVDAVQLLGTAVAAADDPEAEVLGADRVPEMLDLVGRTKPGPFRTRTVEMGRFLGIRRGGELVAMAGERLRLPGSIEISGVCTDPAHRGRGLAGRLVRAVVHGIRAAGATPFLHVAVGNTAARRLYGSLGFAPGGEMTFTAVRVPGVEQT
jgi:ribosomal protein S18 acetylase RimI-like enzyme